MPFILTIGVYNNNCQREKPKTQYYIRFYAGLFWEVITMFGLTPYERSSALRNYDIFKEMENLEKQFFSPGNIGFKTDIIDNGGEFVLKADLPGFKKEDISIDVSGGYLTISAVRNDEKEEKNDKGEYIRRERSYGSFSRSFDISEIDEGAINASFDNGVLTLKLPKLEKREPEQKRIEIQ
jgi:HSP20 family protein